MVRDFTTVVPRSKSEVRQRIFALLAQQRKEIVEKIQGLIPDSKTDVRITTRPPYTEENLVAAGYAQGLSDAIRVVEGVL